jgi:hypothetical protein
VGGSGGRNFGKQVAWFLARLDQRTHPEIHEVCRADQLEDEEQVARGAKQGGEAERGTDHPQDQSKGDASGGEDHATPPVSQSVFCDDRHVRSRRHREQETDSGKRDDLTVHLAQANSGSSKEIS